MNKLILTISGAALACATVLPAAAPVQGPVGFVNVVVPAQSDAMVSIPMNRSSVFQGKVSSIAGNKVTLDAAPSLPAGSTYALVLISGAKEGMAARIAAQSGAQLTLSLDAGDDLTGVAAGANGDKVSIIPYWTPTSLLPATLPAGVKILGFDSGTAAGINLPASVTYVHNGGGIWKNGASGADASAALLPFGGGFILRNPTATPLKIMLVGEAPIRKHRLKLSTLAGNTPQDIRFGYVSAVAENLNNAGLTAQEGDQIFGYDNAATGFNKAPSQMLVMAQGVWKDVITDKPVGSTFSLKPGFAYVYRKAATGTPSISIWSDAPSYLLQQP